MPPADAIAAFEKAIKAVQRHEYERGARAFRELIVRYPAERALLERARVYVELCQRELEARAPKTLEERMTAATAALNDGDDAGAARLAKSILAEDRNHDLALYLLAAVEIRRGRTEPALHLLARAIEISPEAGAQARFDADFEPLRDNATFRQLTDSHGGSGPTGSSAPVDRLRER
jgi:tetratricopeptide (TPR) repeat protein